MHAHTGWKGVLIEQTRFDSFKAKEAMTTALRKLLSLIRARRGPPRKITFPIVGVTFGTFSAILVTKALLEITFSEFFSLVFGLFLFALAAVIAFRGKTVSEQDEELTHETQHYIYPENAQKKRTLKKSHLLYAFAALIAAAGLCTILVNKNFRLPLSPIAKIPMYSLVGVSFSFALTFGFVDAINAAVPIIIRVPHSKPIHNVPQIMCVFGGSLLVGLTYGFFFGCFDVEDDTAAHVRLIEDQYTCMPISAVVGLLAGVATEKYGRCPSSWIGDPRSTEEDIIRFDEDMSLNQPSLSTASSPFAGRGSHHSPP